MDDKIEILSCKAKREDKGYRLNVGTRYNGIDNMYTCLLEDEILNEITKYIDKEQYISALFECICQETYAFYFMKPLDENDIDNYFDGINAIRSDEYLKYFDKEILYNAIKKIINIIVK